MKKFASYLFVSLMLVFTVACNKGAKTEGGDAAKTENSTTTAPAADPNAATASTNPADPNAAQVDPNVPKTTVQFEESEYNFGKIKEGDKVVHNFKFKNTGKEPLIINSAKGSCGCTVPEWPKEPIAPGASGEIKVEFNSKGKSGQQSKSVTIMANTDPNPSHLTIKGDVTPDPNAPKTAAPAQPAINVQPQGK